MSNAQVLRSSPLSLLLLMLLGCSHFTPLKTGRGVLSEVNTQLMSSQLEGDTTNVQSLHQNRQTNFIARLTGKVGRQVPFLGFQAYELQDATGVIWVLTTKTAPQLGDEVIVQGVVRYHSISLGGKESGEWYIEEQEKIVRTTQSPSPQI